MTSNMIKNIISTIIWACAFFVFAYPTLIEAFFNATKDFQHVYYEEQGKVVALFANIGFLFLASYDYLLGQREVHLNAWMIGLIFVGIFCIGSIFGLALMMVNNNITNYPILNKENLCFWFHGIFLFMLLIIKFLTLNSTHQNVNAKGLNK